MKARLHYAEFVAPHGEIGTRTHFIRAWIM